MKIGDLVFYRLYQQRIIGLRFEQSEDVVRWMGALQAQDYHQAVWAVGLRTRSVTLSGVEQAIADGKIIRTWPMRGTIHFVSPGDIKWMLRISSDRMIAGHRRRREELKLDDSTLERSMRIFFDALQGGRIQTRAGLFGLLEDANISTANQRGYHIIGHAAYTGLICMGPMQNKQQTFVLLDEWAPTARDLPREEALVRLAGRYFTSHGPATLRDFAWWAGLNLTDARIGLAGAGEELVSETLDGQEYWLAPGVLETAQQNEEEVHLLPGFDEYLLGYTDRTAVLGGAHAQKIVPGGNGMFRPMLVTGGQVTGSWISTLMKKRLRIAITPFTNSHSSEASIWAAAERYSHFLNLELSALEVQTGESTIPPSA